MSTLFVELSDDEDHKITLPSLQPHKFPSIQKTTQPEVVELYVLLLQRRVCTINQVLTIN